MFLNLHYYINSPSIKMKYLEISNYSILGGAYSIVLIDNHCKVAFKLFKSYDHPDLNGTEKERFGKEMINNYRRKVFTSEVDAYVQVQRSEVLRKFTPNFFGTRKFNRVLNYQQDITYQYLPECCINMEFIEGDDYKIIELMANSELLEEFEKEFDFNLSVLIQEFHSYGILYLNDASIIINKNGVKIIDFGINRVGDYPNIDI
jgi:serine/threonine protein kinase